MDRQKDTFEKTQQVQNDKKINPDFWGKIANSLEISAAFCAVEGTCRELTGEKDLEDDSE